MNGLRAQRHAGRCITSPTSRLTSRAARSIIGSTTTRRTTGAAPIPTGPTSRCPVRKPTDWRKPAMPTPPASSCSPTRCCAGGGRTRTRRSTTPATGRVRCRAAPPRPGCRNRSRLPSPSTASRRCDRCTNQPNVFYDPKSTESFTPFWSAWQPTEGGGFAPVLDDTLAQLGLQAVYEYWVTDGQNTTSTAGVKMIEPAFLSAWNWDARPFPFFPHAGRRVGRCGELAVGQLAMAARDRSSPCPRRMHRRLRRTARPDTALLCRARSLDALSAFVRDAGARRTFPAARARPGGARPCVGRSR